MSHPCSQNNLLLLSLWGAKRGAGIAEEAISITTAFQEGTAGANQPPPKGSGGYRSPEGKGRAHPFANEGNCHHELGMRYGSSKGLSRTIQSRAPAVPRSLRGSRMPNAQRQAAHPSGPGARLPKQKKGPVLECYIPSAIDLERTGVRTGEVHFLQLQHVL